MLIGIYTLQNAPRLSTQLLKKVGAQGKVENKQIKTSKILACLLAINKGLTYIRFTLDTLLACTQLSRHLCPNFFPGSELVRITEMYKN